MTTYFMMWTKSPGSTDRYYCHTCRRWLYAPHFCPGPRRDPEIRPAGRGDTNATETGTPSQKYNAGAFRSFGDGS